MDQQEFEFQRLGGAADAGAERGTSSAKLAPPMQAGAAEPSAVAGAAENEGEGEGEGRPGAPGGLSTEGPATHGPSVQDLSAENLSTEGLLAVGPEEPEISAPFEEALTAPDPERDGPPAPDAPGAHSPAEAAQRALVAPSTPPAPAVFSATDSPLDGPAHGQTDLMAYPFFGLSKTPSKQSISYEEGGVGVQVRPSERGVATIYDKEILIYLASLAVERMKRGEAFDGVLTFTAYDFFKLAGLSGASGKNYQRLAGSLERLQGTQIRTTIETGGVNVDGWFSWISEAHVVFTRDAKGRKRARAIRVRITDWLVRAIAADGSVLTYDPAYFGLTAIERRLYEIARAGCAPGPDGAGSGEGFSMSLDALRARVGVTSPLKKFRQLLAQVEQRDGLPAYRVEILDPAGRAPLARVRVALRPRPDALPRGGDGPAGPALANDRERGRDRERERGRRPERAEAPPL